MQTAEELHGLQRLIESIVDAGTKGDIYELGTWRAGTAIFMVCVFRAYERLKKVDHGRRFFFFDSFEGFRRTGDDGLDEFLANNAYAAPLALVSCNAPCLFFKSSTYIC